MADFIFNISVPVKKAEVMSLPAKQKIIRFSNMRLELNYKPSFYVLSETGNLRNLQKLIRLWLKCNKKAILPTSYISDLPDKALTYKNFRGHPEFCSPASF
jgi:hypothetical protein